MTILIILKHCSAYKHIHTYQGGRALANSRSRGVICSCCTPGPNDIAKLPTAAPDLRTGTTVNRLKGSGVLQLARFKIRQWQL